jgi:hypothetical protein
VKGPEAAVAATALTTLRNRETIKKSDLHFIITQGPSTIDSSGKTRLKASIPASAFTPGQWSKVEIEYNDGSPEVRVSGIKIDGTEVDYNPNQEHYNDEQDNSGQQSYMALFLQPTAGDTLPAGEYSVDEIILENSISSYRFNAGSAVDYHIPGTILSWGKYDVLKDVTIQSAVESAFRTSPEQENIEHFAGLLTQSKLTGTVLDTLLSVDLRVNTNPQETTWNAGYGIERDFGPLSVNEDFYTGSLGESLGHDVSLDLESKVTAGIAASAEYEDTRLGRNWETYAGIKPFDNNESGIRADFFADWLHYDEDPDYWSSSFGDSWIRSWDAMMPDAGWNAERRRTGMLWSGTVDTHPIGALVFLEGESTYNKIQSTTLSDSNVRLEFPFYMGKTNASFQLERGYNWGLNYSGESVYDDGQTFMNSLKTSAPLWASLPFYSLFSEDMYDTMNDVYNDSEWKSETESSRFHDLAGINFQFPLRSGLPAFFLPSAFDVSLNRSLHQKLDTISDVLNLNTSVNFVAVNMFGAFGSVPIMKFYQSDEFSNRLQANFAFPRDEDMSWQLLAGQSMSFFGFTDAVLVLDNTLTITDTGWSESLKIDWLVPTKNSLLSIFYSFLMNKALTLENSPSLSEIAAQPFSQLRNETLELSLTKSEEELVMGLDMRHESLIRLEGRLNFSVFAELSTLYYSETEILSFIGTIGTMLHVIF